MDEQTTNPRPGLGRPWAWITRADLGEQLGISPEMRRGES